MQQSHFVKQKFKMIFMKWENINKMQCGIALSKYPPQGHLHNLSQYIHWFVSSIYLLPASPIRAQFQFQFRFSLFSTCLKKIFSIKGRRESGTLLSPLVKTSPLQFYAFSFNCPFMYYFFRLSFVTIYFRVPFFTGKRIDG